MKISESSKKLICLLPNKIYINKNKCKNNEILVTGGAGFLGIHILKNLLLSKKYTKIHTIVRNPEKLIKQAEYFNLGIEWISQITVITGDLLEIKDCLFPNVEFVIHSAAQIHCIKTLKQLWNNNVETTEKIAQIYQKNKLFFISTLSVFVSSNLIGNHENKSLLVSDDYCLYGGYAQSKFIGEKIIEKYKQNIIRLGLITGSSKDGIFPEDFFTNFIKANKQLGFYPEEFEEALVDITPVDYVVNLVAEVIQGKEKIIHIANKKATSLSQIVSVLNLKKLKKEDWLKKVEKMTNLEQILLKFAFFKNETMSSNRDYFNIDLFQTTNHTYNIKKYFDQDNESMLKLYSSKILEIKK